MRPVGPDGVTQPAQRGQDGRLAVVGGLARSDLGEPIAVPDLEVEAGVQIRDLTQLVDEAQVVRRHHDEVHGDMVDRSRGG